MAWKYDRPRAIYPDAQSSLDTGEGLGVTHSTRTPYERALRNFYMQANRNRAKKPEDLLRAAALAEDAGIDASGSLTSVSQQNTRNQRLAAIDAQQAQAMLLSQYRKAQQEDFRRRMREAASSGGDLEAMKAEAVALGSDPAQYDRAANALRRSLKNRKAPIIDRRDGGPVTEGTPGKDDQASVLSPGQAVIKTDAAKTLSSEDLNKINAQKATVDIPGVTRKPAAGNRAPWPSATLSEDVINGIPTGDEDTQAAQEEEDPDLSSLMRKIKRGANLVSGTMFPNLSAIANGERLNVGNVAGGIGEAATTALTFTPVGPLAAVGTGLMQGFAPDIGEKAAQAIRRPTEWAAKNFIPGFEGVRSDEQMAADNAAAEARHREIRKAALAKKAATSPSPTPTTMRKGGPVRKSAAPIVPALVMKGEYVMKKSAVDHYGEAFMDNLNKARVRKDAKGRFVLSAKSRH